MHVYMYMYIHVCVCTCTIKQMEREHLPQGWSALIPSVLLSPVQRLTSSAGDTQNVYMYVPQQKYTIHVHDVAQWSLFTSPLIRERQLSITTCVTRYCADLVSLQQSLSHATWQSDGHIWHDVNTTSSHHVILAGQDLTQAWGETMWSDYDTALCVADAHQLWWPCWMICKPE